MFSKAFKIKSQTQMKNSEKKRLKGEIQALFPSLSEEDVNSLIPIKEEAVLIKLQSNKGDIFMVYQIAKNPLFFHLEKNKQMFPTVYTLWKFTSLVPCVRTHPEVLEKLAAGADLMIPGVIRNEVECQTVFESRAVVSVAISSSKIPVAVGLSLVDSTVMFAHDQQGKGISISHIYGDFLWKLGSKSAPPEVSEESCSVLITDGASNSGEVKVEGPSDVEVPKCTDAVVEDIEEFESSCVITESDPIPVQGIVEAEEMDHMLEHCFLKAWKCSGKKISLPLLTSNFYRNYLLPVCPDNVSLDVKKSSYKKLSKFLDAMAKKGIIQVKEHPKGVENITEVNFSHESLTNFTFDKDETAVKVEEGETSSRPSFVLPVIEELYQVSGDTINFFRLNMKSKGDVLTTSEVREIVTDYIKGKKLQIEGQNLVNLDPVLHEAVVNRKEGYKETLKWNDIFSRMLGKMAPAVRITRPGEPPVIRKGKLEPIELAVARRTGNKKVTLVYNVGVYGIDEMEFAHQIQVGVAASTSVGQAEHKPRGTIQVLVQGFQINFISKLLLEDYKIPRKYIRGLELATKNKR